MELVVVPFQPKTNLWRVTALGYGGSEESFNSELIYEGPSPLVAKRIHMEILALARVFRGGRGSGPEYEYSHALAGLFQGAEPHGRATPESPGLPFEWARECWSQDVAYRDSVVDATIDGSVVEWIDENGALRPVEPRLSPEEASLLAAIPEVRPGFACDVSALRAVVESMELGEETPAAGRPQARPRSI